MALAGRPLDVTLGSSRPEQWNMVFPQKDEIITSLLSALDSMVRVPIPFHPCVCFQLLRALLQPEQGSQ